MTDHEQHLQLLYGDAALAPPPRLPLRAGPLTLDYEGGDLRYIRLGETEILRRVYAVVRDDAWGTVPMRLTETHRDIRADGFHIAYVADCDDPAKGISFRFRATLTGGPDGTVTFDFDGEALSTFRRNRIGICVLHPASVAGKPCTIRHTDHTTETGAFPDAISPHQPFFDIAAIAQEAAPGVTATVLFTDEVFEMEDQRNWTDASYKTYSTPLGLPFPVEVPQGTTIRQTVMLTLTGAATTDTAAENPPLICDIGEANGRRFPGFGLMLPADGQPTPEGAASRIGNIRLDHLRADIDFAHADWAARFERARAEARRLDGPLIAGIKNGEMFAGPMPETDGVIACLLLPPTPETIDGGRQVLPLEMTLGGGWATNFTELNRNRPQPGTLDALVYAVNPQVHAFDATSIMETPPMIAETLRTARTFSGDAAVYVGPVTLYGPYTVSEPRQQTLFGAAWYAAALAYAANGGADRITLCEPSGPRGVVADDGAPYPLYSLLAALGVATGGCVHHVTVSDPMRVACLALCAPDGACVWQDIFIVNLTPEMQSVTVRGLAGESARVRTLDETTTPVFSDVRVATPTGGELSIPLRPYGIAQIISGQEVH
jgi:D-apionolactonase